MGAQVRAEVIQPELPEMLPSGASNTVALLRIDHQVEGLTRVHQLLHELQGISRMHVVVGAAVSEK